MSRSMPTGLIVFPTRSFSRIARSFANGVTSKSLEQSMARFCSGESEKSFHSIRKGIEGCVRIQLQPDRRGDLVDGFFFDRLLKINFPPTIGNAPALQGARFQPFLNYISVCKTVNHKDRNA